MQGRQSISDDELRRRREARRMKAQAEANMRDQDGEDEEEEIPKFSWSDTFAMIIAAYQVLLPMLLAMIGTIVAAYFLFTWIFA